MFIGGIYGSREDRNWDWGALTTDEAIALHLELTAEYIERIAASTMHSRNYPALTTRQRVQGMKACKAYSNYHLFRVESRE